MLPINTKQEHDLPLHQTVHHPGFAAAYHDDADAEQQTADQRAWRRYFGDGVHPAGDDDDQGDDRADRHAQRNRFGHRGAPADPQIAECGSEANLPSFNQNAKTRAEQGGGAEHRFAVRVKIDDQSGISQPDEAADVGLDFFAFLDDVGRVALLQNRLALPPRRADDFGAREGADGRRHDKQPGMQRKLRHAGKKRGEVAAERHARPEAGHEPADQPLQQAALLAGHPDFEIVAEQHHQQRADEHAPDDPAVRAGERRSFHMD